MAPGPGAVLKLVCLIVPVRGQRDTREEQVDAPPSNDTFNLRELLGLLQRWKGRGRVADDVRQRIGRIFWQLHENQTESQSASSGITSTDCVLRLSPDMRSTPRTGEMSP